MCNANSKLFKDIGNTSTPFVPYCYESQQYECFIFHTVVKLSYPEEVVSTPMISAVFMIQKEFFFYSFLTFLTVVSVTT